MKEHLENRVEWKGAGWYTVVKIQHYLVITPDLKYFSLPAHVTHIVNDCKHSRHYLLRKPGPFESRKYWSGQAIHIREEFNER